MRKIRRNTTLAFALAIFLLLLIREITAPPPPSTPAPPTTLAPSKAVTGLTETPVVLSPIPLPVGYGMRGSWFELYFTDPLSPRSKQRSGGPDGPLAAAIDGARLSVDAAIYSLSLDSVRDALLRAHRRGVQVRIVMESDNMDRADPQILREAGLPMLGDRREGLMHNKFIVIDRSEVWTGSMNFTDAGTYSDNNNLLRIHSTQVAEDYETEFNEMFVDDKFGKDALSATPNPQVTLDGVLLEVYFSPDDHVQAVLRERLDQAQSSIYFLAYSFTADPLGETIRQRAAAGIKVAGVMDADQVKSNIGSEYDAFRAAGLDVRLDGNAGLMHHKVIIIDGQIVVTGSYNFSASAETTNDENLLIIHSPEIAAQYMQEFQRVYAAAQP